MQQSRESCAAQHCPEPRSETNELVAVSRVGRPTVFAFAVLIAASAFSALDRGGSLKSKGRRARRRRSWRLRHGRKSWLARATERSEGETAKASQHHCPGRGLRHRGADVDEDILIVIVVQVLARRWADLPSLHRSLRGCRHRLDPRTHQSSRCVGCRRCSHWDQTPRLAGEAANRSQAGCTWRTSRYRPHAQNRDQPCRPGSRCGCSVLLCPSRHH